MSNTDILLGLGVGVGIGFAAGYLFVQWRRGAPAAAPAPTTALTTFTRDEQGRIIEIMERPVQ